MPVRLVNALRAMLAVALCVACAKTPPRKEPPPAAPPPSHLVTTTNAVASVADLPDADAGPPPPGTRYVSMSREACAAELATREIAHEAIPPRLGITQPVRLKGPLSGVTFRTLWPAEERAKSSFEVLDCRLVLALDDFAKVLKGHGIVDVMYFSAYRPPPAGWSEPVGLRHEGGLAIDIGYFGKVDKTALNVEWDFNPRGERPREKICATGLPVPKDATPKSLELRKIACEAAAAELFHLTLTPAYDHVHRDHFHLELDPEKTDFVAR